MHSLDLPAGALARLTAAARPSDVQRRWGLHVVSASDELTKLVFGSAIGGVDRQQSVDIPAQAAACRLELSVEHATPSGWRSDSGAVFEDNPGHFEIGYRDGQADGGPADELLLSLRFELRSVAAEEA